MTNWRLKADMKPGHAILLFYLLRLNLIPYQNVPRNCSLNENLSGFHIRSCFIVNQLPVRMAFGDMSDLPPPFTFMEAAGEQIERAWVLAEVLIHRHSTILTLFWQTLAVLAYHAYLMGAIYHHIQVGGELDWCTGVGALLIGTVILYAGYLYYGILQPRGSAIYAPIRPTVERVRSFFNRRWFRID